jgi:hypothetical protein
MEIVLALQREGECRGMYGQFVDETKSLLNQLESWYVQHVGREANAASHQIAQHGAILEEERI